MDYNDFLLNNQLDKLEEERIKEEQFNARVTEALEEFKAGEYNYQCEVIDNVLENPFIGEAIRACVSGSSVKLNEIVESSMQSVVSNYEGE